MIEFLRFNNLILQTGQIGSVELQKNGTCEVTMINDSVYRFTGEESLVFWGWWVTAVTNRLEAATDD